ncbi:MAG: hypothetical protein KIT62_10655 [Cyclobacteriaceae bacterium]|nr:hypothetical protein [Cyclobacteriaceae bacterium]
MSRDLLIQKTIDDLKKLPDHKLVEASEFVDFLLSRIEDQSLTKEIQYLSDDSNAFSFLEEEPVLYQKSDLKERFK